MINNGSGPQRMHQKIYYFDAFEFNSLSLQLYCNCQIVTMQRRTAEVLRFLISNRDKVITKDELIREIWGNNPIEDGNITQQIYYLRQALKDTQRQQHYIITKPRIGYQFNPLVPLLCDEIPGKDRVTDSNSNVGVVIPNETTSESEEMANGMGNDNRVDRLLKLIRQIF